MKSIGAEYKKLSPLILSLSVVVLVALQVAFHKETQSQRRHPCTNKIKYCDLIRNPQLYEGKEVTVQASYRDGFEFSEMYCLGCRDLGMTWVEFEESAGAKLPKATKQQDYWGRTINATFCGIFFSSGAYGHLNAYQFKFNVKSVRQVKVVYKYGWVPGRLPPEIRSKVCQE